MRNARAPVLEDKFMLSPFEVRIKLAVAYTEIGDHEGAILLLEEVIQDALTINANMRRV